MYHLKSMKQTGMKITLPSLCALVGKAKQFCDAAQKCCLTHSGATSMQSTPFVFAELSGAPEQALVRITAALFALAWHLRPAQRTHTHNLVAAATAA